MVILSRSTPENLNPALISVVLWHYLYRVLRVPVVLLQIVAGEVCFFVFFVPRQNEPKKSNSLANQDFGYFFCYLHYYSSNNNIFTSSVSSNTQEINRYSLRVVIKRKHSSKVNQYKTNPNAYKKAMVYQCNMTTFSLFICLLSFSFPTSVNGWICLEPSKVFAMTRSRATSNTPLHLTISDNEIPQPKSYSDPCWGTMLDDDCSMGNIYAANFVASQWIKSMPCGEGIQVRFLFKGIFWLR